MKIKDIMYHPYSAVILLIVTLWISFNVYTIADVDPANCVEPHPIFYVPCLILLYLIAVYSPSLPKRMDQT